jgi:hypothetical protein
MTRQLPHQRRPLTKLTERWSNRSCSRLSLFSVWLYFLPSDLNSTKFDVPTWMPAPTVLTVDGKCLKLDAAGDAKALAAIKSPKKKENFTVKVTGDVQGGLHQSDQLEVAVGSVAASPHPIRH